MARSSIFVKRLDRRVSRLFACLTGLLLLLGTGASQIGAEAADGPTPFPLVTQEVTVAIPQLDITEAVTLDEGERMEQVNAVIRERALALVTELAPVGNVWGEYQVHLARSGVLSVTMQYSGFGQYMAHPMHVRSSVTVDVKTGTVYSLADLFKDERYMERISEAVVRGLAEWDLPPLVGFEHIAPDQSFYLTPTSLVVYFQLYELLPYAAGFPEFEVPYEDIADIVADEGPLKKIIGLSP